MNYSVLQVHMRKAISGVKVEKVKLVIGRD